MIEIVDIEIEVHNIDDVDSSELSEYDNIFFGSPNHDGLARQKIMKLIVGVGQMNFNTAVFDTCLEKDLEKTVKYVEVILDKKAPGAYVLLPGLSIKVSGMKRHISDDEFSKCREYGKELATEILD